MTAPARPHEIEALLAERILVKDGAMGTMIQREGLAEEDFRGSRFASHDLELKGNSDVLVLTQPELIIDIHERFLEAGADKESNGERGRTPLVLASENDH